MNNLDTTAVVRTPATVAAPGGLGPGPEGTARPGRKAALTAGLAGLGAVVGPGLIAGLSDDDPAGITTYSVLGAGYGYRLLWVLGISTVALILFQDLGARIGVVTGQGLTGLVRQRYGARAGVLTISALILANIGTTTAEFAGIAAGCEIFHVSKYVSVPVVAVGLTLMVMRGGFAGIEKILLALSAAFLAYLGAGYLAHPDWLAAVHGLVVPSMPLNRDAVVICTATLGTTLAPWGLAFIQSYAVDKKLTPHHLKLLRLDVVTGAVLTGVIGLFVVVSCAATLHRQGVSISDATDAAAALKPLAGPLAEELFAVGLIGAALLAASLLPLSTAYSVSDIAGHPAALDDSPRSAPLFYGTITLITAIGAGLVLIPGLSLVPILVGTQVLNAVLLLPLLAYMSGIARDERLMGSHTASRWVTLTHAIVITLITVCIVAMLALSL